MLKSKRKISSPLKGKFKGRIAILNFFISNPDSLLSEWKEFEKDDVTNIIQNCKNYLEYSAGKAGRNLDLSIKSYSIEVNKDPLPVNCCSCLSVDWIDEVIKQTQFKSYEAAVKKIKTRQRREPIFLLHYRMEGCSYAISSGTKSRIAILFFVHNSKLVNRNDYYILRPNRNESIYAHEILHLFGATDRKRPKYPELMGIPDDQLLYTTLSRRTKREIGWL